MKKILYIANANGMGGGNVALLNIVREIQKRGHEVKVVTTTSKGALPERLLKIGCPCIQLNMRANIYPTNPNPVFYLPRLCIMLYTNYTAGRQLERIIRSYAPDIVHTNVGPMNVAVDICRQLGIPHVWHQREYQDLDFNFHFFPNRRKFLSQSHQEGNYNVCITQGVFDYSKFRIGIDRVIYDGVFMRSATDTPHIKEKDNYILFAGRVNPAKGTLDLIRVFCRFHEKYPEFRLLIAGSYQQEPYVEECFRMVETNQLKQSVEFLGERSDVYDLMAHAAMLVVPSRFEGFGFITAEAMLNYCPVIGRDSGGTKEQFDRGVALTGGEIGLRFRNDDEMLEAMCHVVEHNVTDMCIRAHQVVAENYTVEYHVDQLEEYYNFVLNHNA